jgi:hypothetical protein
MRGLLMTLARRLTVLSAAISLSVLFAGCVSVAPAACPIFIPTLAPATATPAPVATTAPTSAPTEAPATAAPATAAPPTDAPATAGPPTEAPLTSAPSSEPTPSGTDDGSVGGEKLRVGDYNYARMADAEWSSEGYQEFFEPAEGNVLYTFLIEFEGLDPDGSSYNPLDFTFTVNETPYSWYLFGKDPKLESGELAPGETASGWLTFEAPLADTVTLLYAPVSGMVDGSAEWTVTINE